MIVSPLHPPAQVIAVSQARLRRLAAGTPALALLVELAGCLAQTNRFADLDALVEAVATAWSDEAMHAERAEAVATINGLLRSAVAA